MHLPPRPETPTGGLGSVRSVSLRSPGRTPRSPGRAPGGGPSSITSGSGRRLVTLTGEERDASPSRRQYEDAWHAWYWQAMDQVDDWPQKWTSTVDAPMLYNSDVGGRVLYSPSSSPRPEFARGSQSARLAEARLAALLPAKTSPGSSRTKTGRAAVEV